MVQSDQPNHLWRHFFIVTLKLPSDVLHPDLIHAKRPYFGRKFIPLIKKRHQTWPFSVKNGEIRPKMAKSVRKLPNSFKMTFSHSAFSHFKPAIIFIFRAKIAVIGRKFSNLIKKGHELCPSSVKNGQIPSKMVKFYEKWPTII